MFPSPDESSHCRILPPWQVSHIENLHVHPVLDEIERERLTICLFGDRRHRGPYLPAHTLLCLISIPPRIIVMRYQLYDFHKHTPSNKSTHLPLSVEAWIIFAWHNNHCNASSRHGLWGDISLIINKKNHIITSLQTAICFYEHIFFFFFFCGTLNIQASNAIHVLVMRYQSLEINYHTAPNNKSTALPILHKLISIMIR